MVCRVLIVCMYVFGMRYDYMEYLEGKKVFWISIRLGTPKLRYLYY